MEATGNPEFPADIIAVGSDCPCPGLDRAKNKNIDTFCVSVGDFADRTQWNEALADATESFKPDLVVSAGFMRILGENFLDRFGDRTINTHPALLPSFPGAHAVRDAMNYGVKWTGSTIHLVDKGTDTGPVLVQEPVEILPDDDIDSLHERIKVVERRNIVKLIADIAENGIVNKITRLV